MSEVIQNFPFVSCIMPTCNRRAFVPQAIQYFLSQDYPNKELVIVDDGKDCIRDIVPDHEQIRFFRSQERMTLGEKRNHCIRLSKADLIMHWDDDDWMAPCRISYQVQELLKHNAEVCGLNQLFFYQPSTDKGWLYKYPANAKPWLAGGSLLYTRSFWEASPFPDIQVASDTSFILKRQMKSWVALKDINFYVATIHERNTSPKHTDNRLWHAVDISVIRKIMEHDTAFGNKKENSKLNIVKTGTPGKDRVAVLITTCNRPEFLKKIISDLEKESGEYDLHFFIVDDALIGNGKKNYWKTVNTLWAKASTGEFDYHIQIPDDVELELNFVQRSIAAWNSIDDVQKICLNLLLDGQRMGKTCWTVFWPQLYHYNGQRFLRTQWIDMIFISEKKFFEQLKWEIAPVSPVRWARNPELSSGVGQQISTRLHQKGLHLYQSIEKLLEHIGHVSIMNPVVRKKEPHHWFALASVYGGVASTPDREVLLKKMISTILPYLDRLYVFLNDYSRVPKWLQRLDKVFPFLSNIEKTNKGDAGKFYGLNQIKDNDYYYFSLDDDLLYPPDYTWKLINKIEKHRRKAVVGCGGYTMKQGVTQFYNDRKGNWHFNQANNEDRPVHILHTALTAWHSSTLHFRYSDCDKANMADIWLGLAAQKKQVPMILIERAPDWIKGQPFHTGKSIYDRYRNNCGEQTRVFNSWKEWKLIPVNGEKILSDVTG